MEIHLNVPKVSCYALPLDTCTTMETYLSHILPQNLSSSPTNRKQEFLAGRVCAMKAAELIGIQISDIPTAKNREPVWPSGIVGSISHSNVMAVSCIAKSSDFISVGIDTESLIVEETIKAIKNAIALPSEISFLEESLKGIDFDLKYTLLFSMKEALYKAIYPLNKEFIDFHDVSLISLSIEKQTFSLRYRSRMFAGHFTVSDRSVITIVPIPKF
jgi:enterobactin synthetase component D